MRTPGRDRPGRTAAGDAPRDAGRGDAAPRGAAGSRGGSRRGASSRGAGGRGASSRGAGSRAAGGRSAGGRGGGRPRNERGVSAGSRPGWIRGWGVDAELAPVRDVRRDGPEDDDDDFGPDDFGPEGPRDSLTDVPGGVRLQKVLAAAGIGSRRHCEELIGAGRIEVDGEIVRRYGARVDPENQIIRVDGRRIAASEKLVHVALNKPAGVLTTMSDSRGRRTIADLLGDRTERLFHVGRLDYDTEGLMLLMNDGELAHRLAHPRYRVLKTYLADVPAPLERDLGRRLMTGIQLEDGVASADRFRVVERAGSRALVEITLHEGRKHIVRRMLAEAGHPVSRLVRTQVGPVSLGALRSGATRRLTVREVGDLYAAVGL